MSRSNYSVGSIPRGVLAWFLPKSRDIQVKMPSPKVIFNAIFPVPVKVLNSYKVTQEESDTFRKSLGLDLRKVLLLKNVL